MSHVDHGERCISETCFGDGLMDWSEEEIEGIIEGGGDTPKRCHRCADWAKSLDTQEIRCQICGERETRTREVTVGLPRFNKIDLDELDQPICSTCILSNAEERDQRREKKHAANRINGARGRTYDALASNTQTLRARGASKRKTQAIAARMRMGPNAVTMVDSSDLIRDRIVKWTEPLANQTATRAMRFAEIGRDGLPKATAMPSSVEEARWKKFRERFAGASASGQAFYGALIENPAIDHHLLVRAFGNAEVPPDLADALPGALARVLVTHPGTAGVFQAMGKYRNIERRGEVRSWAQDLASGGETIGRGAAYEIIGLDRLIHGASEALPIYPLDELTLGQKIPFNGVFEGAGGVNGRALRGLDPPADKNAAAGSLELARTVGDRRTIEADAMITRYQGGHERNIAIDFKYRTHGDVPDYGPGKDPKKTTSIQQQIAGAVLAVEQGHIHEFHFVSNQGFRPEFVAHVNWGNGLLAQSGMGGNRIQLHGFVGLRP